MGSGAYAGDIKLATEAGQDTTLATHHRSPHMLVQGFSHLGRGRLRRIVGWRIRFRFAFAASSARTLCGVACAT